MAERRTRISSQELASLANASRAALRLSSSGGSRKSRIDPSETKLFGGSSIDDSPPATPLHLEDSERELDDAVCELKIGRLVGSGTSSGGESWARASGKAKPGQRRAIVEGSLQGSFNRRSAELRLRASTVKDSLKTFFTRRPQQHTNDRERRRSMSHSPHSQHSVGHNLLHAAPQWYVPHLPHVSLHGRHGDVIPTRVLLEHSPFAHLCTDRVLLEKLANAFTTVRFSKGDSLPDSPFYMISRGAVRVARVLDGRPVTAARPAGSFINWSGEYRRVQGAEASVSEQICAALGRRLLPGWLERRVRRGQKTRRRSRAADYDEALELVGTCEGNACYLSPKLLQRFMDSEPRALELIRRCADACMLHSLAPVKAARLSPDTLRRLTLLATFRHVPAREPLFHEAEIGHAFAIVLDGMLQVSLRLLLARRAALPRAPADGPRSALA